MFKKRLDNVVRYKVGLLCCPMQGQELVSMIALGPCQKHSVANNVGSGNDLSEVVLFYSRLQWRVSCKQERTY